jgi:hypothetical protein
MQDDVQQKRDFESVKTELSEKLKEQKETATETFRDARETITGKAGDYASETKEALFEQAEGTQKNISANMAAFGGALRAASEHLATSDQRAASKFVLDAAGGVERISSSLKDKPFEAVLVEIRDFGRQNSGALIAGSVLAGLALGRFIKSASPPANAAGETEVDASVAGVDRSDCSVASPVDLADTTETPRDPVRSVDQSSEQIQ